MKAFLLSIGVIRIRGIFLFSTPFAKIEERFGGGVSSGWWLVAGSSLVEIPF